MSDDLEKLIDDVVAGAAPTRKPTSLANLGHMLERAGFEVTTEGMRAIRRECGDPTAFDWHEAGAYPLPTMQTAKSSHDVSAFLRDPKAQLAAAVEYMRTRYGGIPAAWRRRPIYAVNVIGADGGGSWQMIRWNDESDEEFGARFAASLQRLRRMREDLERDITTARERAGESMAHEDETVTRTHEEWIAAGETGRVRRWQAGVAEELTASLESSNRWSVPLTADEYTPGPPDYAGELVPAEAYEDEKAKRRVLESRLVVVRAEREQMERRAIEARRDAAAARDECVIAERARMKVADSLTDARGAVVILCVLVVVLLALVAAFATQQGGV